MEKHFRVVVFSVGKKHRGIPLKKMVPAENTPKFFNLGSIIESKGFTPPKTNEHNNRKKPPHYEEVTNLLLKNGWISSSLLC